MVLQLALTSQALPSFYDGIFMEKKILRSKELFGEEKLVFIEHENAVYRLMITRQGKLILNK